MKGNHRSILAAWLVLLFAIAACNFGARPSTPAPMLETAMPVIQISPVIATEQSPVPMEIETEIPPTAEPSIEIPATQAAPGFSAEGVSFTFDPVIASGVTVELVEGTPPSQDVAPWDVGPDTRQFSFDGYLLKDTFHNPVVLVYPVADYEAMDENVKQIMENLRGILADPGGTPPDQLPFLPSWNAGPVMHARYQVIQFQNGSGVRYLTQYAQSFAVINNTDLFYTFQGLTSDGKYYIAAILPVANPNLPANGDTVPGGDYNAFMDTYSTYVSDAVAQLESYSPATFVPNLDALDGLFESMRVE